MKIVFLDSYSVGDADLTPIKQLGDYTEYENTQPEDVVARCADADVVITNKVRIFRAQIDSLPKLRLICVAATGTNNVDSAYAVSKGILVKNVPAYSTQSVAEATFSLVLALLRGTIFYDNYVKGGSYAVSGRCFNLHYPISQISGKRWGVIGLGNIGRRVAEFATAFGADVIYYSTSGKNNSTEYTSVSLDELLEESDIVSIHSPLNEQTENLLDMYQLQKMKRSAILVNVGRGKIINEEALAKALDEGLIAGAGLDVFEYEPINEDNPLLRLKHPDRLIVAPHCAWSSAEARKELVWVIARNISENILQ
ncbi:D-3-phosphoglycerate dehydrogenase [Mucinivorans hirudinis]|uniref:D-3-phosphoglycerate dehydrogenase n=1 Tax=Mucinivorans hirudinis TaxID=1433126 RepID=A0A060R702_9BACT|nr:D-3-phosphoglycerate dehydrogenase [Mucinivorans hirudinis]